MDVLPFQYQQIEPQTWAYLSSLLLITLFFKFNRFWSVRNFDVLLVILLAPGLLLIHSGQNMVPGKEKNAQDRTLQVGESESATRTIPASAQIDAPKPDRPGEVNESIQRELAKADALGKGELRQRFGYCWLFAVGGVFLIRLLIDPGLKRRPLLKANLSIGGLVFFGLSLLTFLMANVAKAIPDDDDLHGAKGAVRLIQREAAKPGDIEQLRRRGPGYRLFNLLPIIPSFESGDEILKADVEQMANMNRFVFASKLLAIASQLLIVFGLILFCYRCYDDFDGGVGVATIYLLLPYTAMFTGHVLHALPAAFLVWSFVFYRRPVISGMLMGLATGVSYYPIFLIPLWASFYWDRGVKRFSGSFLVSIAICVGGLAFSSVDTTDFLLQVRAMFGFWQPLMAGLEGVWSLGWNQWWRLPILVTFVLFCISFVFWPTEKNVGTLIAYTGAVMVAVQFWHGFGGGLYVAWYMPMALLTFFRPNLIGRIATEELRERNRKRKETPEDILTEA